jgi:hypothetical protein
MATRKFPERGTPLFDKVVARIERGDDYKDIAASLDMTWRSFKDAVCNVGIKKKQSNFEGVLPPVYEFPKSATWEEHLDTIKKMDNLVAFHQRVPGEITIKVDTDVPIIRAITSDWQLGQFGVDYTVFKEDMEYIRDNPLKVNIGGDGYQNIIQPSKMGSSHNQTPISVQKGLYVLTLEMLQNSIDTVRTGNHNYWAAMFSGEDWDMEIIYE